MADPLSIAGSAVGIISLGITVAQGLFNYYTAFRDKNSDVGFTTKKLNRLSELLQTLQLQLEQRQFRIDEQELCSSIPRYIEESEELIQDLDAELQKLRSSASCGSLYQARAAGRRLIYPLRQSTLQKLDEDIDALVVCLSFALQLLQQNDIGRIQNDLEDAGALLDLVRASQISSDITTWLKAPDASINFNDAMKKKHPGTGKWLVDGSAFTGWLEKPNSFLWLVGFAGCGKSVLCSTAIQAAHRHRRGNPQIGIAFFYFTFNDEGKQDSSAMLRALVLQLSSQKDNEHSILSRLHDKYRNATPSDQALIDCLRQLVRSFTDVHICVDALDESPRDAHREGVLQVIADLRAWSEPGLHLLVSSRDEIDIREDLDASPEEAVQMRNESVDEDIASFVSQNLRENRRLRKWTDYHGKIETAFTTRAQGVFRWVECQFKALITCPGSEDLLEQVLNSLPRTLDETYARMLANIPPSSISYSQRMLALLCCARKPLSVEELICGIAFKQEGDMEFDPKRKLMSADAIHQICPGFVEFDIDPYDHTTTVRLAHFSVREYLESDRILLREDVAAFSVNLLDADRLMASICLAVLMVAPNLNLEPLVEDQAFQFFTSTGGAFEDWYARRRMSYGRPIGSPHDSLLYRAASFGLEPIVRRSLRSGITTVREMDAPLIVASKKGHERVLRLLIGNGADTEAQDKAGITALHNASCRGDTKVARLLLESGADIEAQDKVGKTALHYTSFRNNTKFVQLLLESGADLEAQNKVGMTALHYALFYGDAKFVRLLLESGADIEAQDKAGITALHQASYRGDAKVVRLLLESGADLEAQSIHGWTALHYATNTGRGGECILHLLLEKGACVNSRSYNLGTALLLASRRCPTRFVNLLLEYGAAVNDQNRRGGTALHHATKRSNKEMVELLLENGADVNIQDQYGRTALDEAADSEETIKLLLEKGGRHGT
ncbi:hypothetical protein FZEAL_10414 [Fusarium zealandicum]|uniref:Ankyrin repeat protein n=1 Tax=Fusarium zealandicum TaxID=1053134 RepID=A0A8H4U1Y0_9HYPO|nr:hypothetical protein FZEAL_10414 [Fusarium zealandicum]